MSEKEEKEKKIIIDEDWKQQAQKEKEILKAKAEVEKCEKEEQAPSEASGPLPKGDFAALVSMLATQALFALGLIAVEKDVQPKADVRLAKFHIDMLEAIEEKTKGNLDEAENKMLADTLSQLRMSYVKVVG